MRTFKTIFLSVNLCFTISANAQKAVSSNPPISSNSVPLNPFRSLGVKEIKEIRENTNTSGFNWNRVSTIWNLGGGAGFFGNNSIFSISGNAFVGYRNFKNNFIAGPSFALRYYRDNNYYRSYGQSYPLSNFIYSFGTWARYSFGNFYVQSQFEYHFSNMNWSELNYNLDKENVKLNFGIPSLLVGGGYTQAISKNVYANIGIYYDVLQKTTAREMQASNGKDYKVFSPYYNNIDIQLGVGMNF